jgi:hypothetical protein
MRGRNHHNDGVPLWPDLDTVQAAIDAVRYDYNIDRPHQSVDMAFPTDRFRPADPPPTRPVTQSWHPVAVSCRHGR